MGTEREGLAQAKCHLCGADNPAIHYNGPIRAGKPGILTYETYEIYRCGRCDVAFLHPSPQMDYSAIDYRRDYNESTDIESYFHTHDRLHISHLFLMKDFSFRGKRVADFGCGGGSFLDLLKTVSLRTIAVEPFTGYHESLRNRGHTCYPSTSAMIAAEGAGCIDLAASFHVVEHVEDPSEYLREIYISLKPGGLGFIATPNHDEFLVRIGLRKYLEFFYRTAHIWYFSKASLRHLLEKAGFDICDEFGYQEYDLSNTLLWMRDGIPTGNGGIPILDDRVNREWKSFLETSGGANAICIIVQKPGV